MTKPIIRYTIDWIDDGDAGQYYEAAAQGNWPHWAGPLAGSPNLDNLRGFLQREADAAGYAVLFRYAKGYHAHQAALQAAGPRNLEEYREGDA